jgi:hypothetical protein
LLGDREGKYCLATLSDKEKEAAFWRTAVNSSAYQVKLWYIHFTSMSWWKRFLVRSKKRHTSFYIKTFYCFPPFFYFIHIVLCLLFRVVYVGSH